MANLLDIVPTRAQRIKSIKIQQSEFKAVVFEPQKNKLITEKLSAQWKISNKDNKNSKNHKENSEDDEDDDDDEESNQRRLSKRKRADDTEFDIKRACNEVLNFALSGGYKKERNKKKAEIALLVKLGAKPPPRTYRNYKEILKDKARSKIRREEKSELAKLGKNQCGAATTKCRKINHQKKKKSIIVGGINKHYGVANPNIKKRK